MCFLFLLIVIFDLFCVLFNLVHDVCLGLRIMAHLINSLTNMVYQHIMKAGP